MNATVLREKSKGSPGTLLSIALPFHFLHIVCISVKEVGHGVFDSFMLESRSCSKDSHTGDSGTELSHSLALEVKYKYNRQVTQESYHLTTSLAME